MKNIFSWFERRINPYPNDIQTVPSSKFFQFIRTCLVGISGWLLLLMFLSTGVSIFEAMLFKMIGMLVDWLSTDSVATFWSNRKTTLLIMLAVIIVSPLWVFLRTNVRHQTLQGAFPMRLRWRFHRLLLAQSFNFYQDEFAGRLSAKVMQTALAVREVVMTCTDIFVYISVYLVSTAVILAQFNGLFLIPFALWIIIFIAIIIFFIPRIGKVSEMQADARSLMTGRITDSYTNIATVKLFSHTERETDYAQNAMQEFIVTVHKQMRYVSVLESLKHLINMSLIVSVTTLGIWLWLNNHVSVGAVAAATAMALRLDGLSHWVLWETAKLFENIGTVRDGMNTLSQSANVVDIPNAKDLKVEHGAIKFEDVTFAYTNDDPLFYKFDLNIKAGEKIGVVGRSGSGKSTIVNLLLRFYDIQSGKISIDGQDISQVTQNSLRSQIGMVTQDTSLLHRSIRDNIAYGRPDATDAEIFCAAKQAQADVFIEHLVDSQGRQGYDAYVGERGVKLSGGQRQRIAIARVMLKDAPILLLDEATSALDSEVETAIQDSLAHLMENKTVIAIAHRLSTIAAMDRLIVFDQGEIVEQGSHEELLAKDGLYAKLWQHQSGGFLAKEHD